MFDLKQINSENIKNGLLEKDVPELYELKNVFGNNNWHYETTFDHTVNVLKEFEKFFEEYKNFFDDKKKN